MADSGSIVDALNDGRYDDPKVLTFLGAVVLGGIVLFFFLKISLGGSSDDDDAASSKTAGADKKKKNKKKKKSTSGDDSEPAPAQPVANNVAAKAKKGKKKKAAKVEAEPKAPAPATATASATKKKKKKKAAADPETKASATKASAPAQQQQQKKVAKKASDNSNDDPWEVKVSRDDASGYADDGWSMVADKPVVKKKKPAPASGSSSSATAKTSVTVETRALHLIIGKGGATITKLKEATGVQIDIPKVPEGAHQPKTTTISLTGSDEGVKACGEAIRDLTTKGLSAITHGTFSEATVEVHADYNQFLFSKPRGPDGGTVLKTLEQATNTQIKLGSVARSGQQFYKIYGKKVDTDKVKSIIKDELLRNFHSALTHPGMIASHMQVPEAQHRYIIGVKGGTIKRIQGNSKCKINIPGKNSRTRSVVIVGTPVNVASAKKQIENELTKIAEQADAAGYGDYDDYDDYSDDY